MVFQADDRLEKIKEIIENEDPIGHEKLFYHGKARRLPVYELPLDCLIFNRHNGRIESEMLTWQHEHDLGPNEYNDEIHELIENFLWTSSRERNEHTKLDIQRKGQLRPGIVSLDGVIIDGNRRAMLLGRIGGGLKFDAVVLKDRYYANEKEIIKLETEYQIGEDSKVEYGPLEKYLKVKRLKQHNYTDDEIRQMMGGITKGELARRVGTMKLMDDYLEHIQCPGLYNLLKERDGTKEGMLVDLYSDLKRISDGRAGLTWTPDEVDLIDLKTIQFDYLRYGTGLFNSGKDYRKISHDGKGEKSFFAKEEIWNDFRDRHYENVHPINDEIGSVEDYISENPDLVSRAQAAQRRDSEWKSKARGQMLGNFNRSNNSLAAEISADEPRELLYRALSALRRVDYTEASFLEDSSNFDMVREINSLTYEMQKRLKKSESH